MCGISGFISNKKEEELINDLTQTLVHRGPDSQGWTIMKVEENIYILDVVVWR